MAGFHWRVARWFLVFAFGFGVGGRCPAQENQSIDDWLKSPYQLTLVISVDRHPLLTPIFVSNLQAEVRDMLQRDLGTMCHIQVADNDPLMVEVLTKGWAELDRRQHLITDRKLHLLRISYDSGQYVIEARQVCGYTALVSPLRRLQTPDRVWVPRLVALTVARDFGMVGVVTKVVRQTVTFRLRNPGATAPESIRVDPGEVLAVSRILKPRGGQQRGIRVRDTLLVVANERDGEYRAALFPSADRLRSDRFTAGFRVIKLGTQVGPLELKVVDAATGDPIPGVGVRASIGGFDTPRFVEMTTNADGRVRSRETFQHVVYVQLSLAGRFGVRVPIPLVDDKPVEFRLAGTEEVARLEEFDYQFRHWRRRLREASLMLADGWRQIDELAAKDEKASARKAAQVAADLRQDIAELRKSLEPVKKLAQDIGPAALAGTRAGEEDLAVLESRATKLEQYVQDIENPTPERVKLRQARLAAEAVEPEKAIALYEESLKIKPDQPDVRSEYEAYKKAWEIKGDRHRDARAFIFQQWGTLEGDALESALPDAEKAFRVVRGVGDFISARKLFLVNLEHLQRLTAQLEGISADSSEDAQEQIDAIKKLFASIQQLNRDVLRFLTEQEE